MIRHILAISGGGIRDVSFLTFMLKLSKYYDKQNIDVLSLFDTFSGVSSGSIVASAFALREQLLQRTAKTNPKVIESALKKINPHYSKDKVSKTIKKLKKMQIVNCSSIVISTMIVFFETEGPHIFYRTTLRTITSLNGLLYSKYGDNRKHVFDTYFDFKLRDVPKGRTLLMKSVDLQKISIKVYTNYVTNIKNNIFISSPKQSISEALFFSSNAPTFFPYNNMSDGGIILNTSLLEQIFLFQNDDLHIFKLSDAILPIEKITFDGLIGWAINLPSLLLYENKILDNLLKYKYDKKICIVTFDLTKYSVDDITKISELEHIGEKVSLNPAIKFIDNLSKLNGMPTKFPLPTKICDYDNPLVIAKAKEITEGSLMTKEQARRISLWIKENSEFHIGNGGYWDLSASESLNNINSFRGKIKGMCFNATNVQIALLRAMGIRSRFAITYMNSQFYKDKLPYEFATRMDSITPYIFAEIWFDNKWHRFDTYRDCDFNTRVDKFNKLNETEDWEINDIPEKGITYKTYLDDFAEIKAKRYTRIERDKMDDFFQNKHNHDNHYNN